MFYSQFDTNLASTAWTIYDTGSYKRLENDPTQKNKKLINETIEQFKNGNFITTNVVQKLNKTNPRTSSFYATSTFHDKGSPDQPVISSLECHKSNIPRHVDCQLQSNVKQMPPNIKDTNYFIKKIKSLSVPKDSIIISLGVKSLHANIKNAKGMVLYL